MVNGGERIVDRGSRQGLWICAPSGKVLARANSRSPERALEVLAAGLAAWKELEPADRRVPDGVRLEPSHRWEHNYPENGLVLERIARDLAPGAPQAEPAERWNRDFAWFGADEVAAMVPADAEVGDVVELPLLAGRLARFHLVDNVRGQTIPYAPEEVELARAEARVVSRDGSTLELELQGETRAASEGPWLLGQSSWTPKAEMPHAIATTLVGRGTFELGERPRFTALELVAVGRFEGRTVFNARRGEDPAGDVVFHLQLADTPMRVAPAFVSIYDADWIVAPPLPTWLETPAECGLETGG